MFTIRMYNLQKPYGKDKAKQVSGKIGRNSAQERIFPHVLSCGFVLGEKSGLDACRRSAPCMVLCPTPGPTWVSSAFARHR